MKPAEEIAQRLKQLVGENDWNQFNLDQDVPRKWKEFGDLIFIREGTVFQHEIWHKFGKPL